MGPFYRSVSTLLSLIVGLSGYNWHLSDALLFDCVTFTNPPCYGSISLGLPCALRQLDLLFDFWESWTRKHKRGCGQWLSSHTVKALMTEEFVSMQAMRAMTADVIASFSLSSAQRCLLRKAFLKSQSPPPLPSPVPTCKQTGQWSRHTRIISLGLNPT